MFFSAPPARMTYSSRAVPQLLLRLQHPLHEHRPKEPISDLMSFSPPTMSAEWLMFSAAVRAIPFFELQERLFFLA